MSYYLALSILSSIKAPQKKHSGAEARRLLSEINKKPLNESSFLREAGGRPYFREQEADFNISHSGNVTAVSFAEGAGLRTGCDVELIRPRPTAAEIAKEYFSPAENKYLFSSGIFDEKRFYEIWTLKECFLKLRGLSVFDMAGAPSFVSDDARSIDKLAFCAPVSLPLSFGLYELNCYMLAVVIEGALMLPKIQWFSQASFDCKMRAQINAAPNPAQTVSPKR